MSNAHFAFRQFSIRQDRCGMKVSMDACIFGAWIPVQSEDGMRILDIGAGTGLLSLMLAQRFSQARIDAVEIDAEAATQASENIDDSIFRDRIRLLHADARTHVSPHRYNLIVSNPPFFSSSMKSPDAARTVARHDAGLSLGAVCEIVSKNLTANGHFALIMPFDAKKHVVQTTGAAALQPIYRVDVRDRASAHPKRSCWVFVRARKGRPLDTAALTIRDDRGYSPEFESLLRDFYLRP